MITRFLSWWHEFVVNRNVVRPEVVYRLTIGGE